MLQLFSFVVLVSWQFCCDKLRISFEIIVEKMAKISKWFGIYGKSDSVVHIPFENAYLLTLRKRVNSITSENRTSIYFHDKCSVTFQSLLSVNGLIVAHCVSVFFLLASIPKKTSIEWPENKNGTKNSVHSNDQLMTFASCITMRNVKSMN